MIASSLSSERNVSEESKESIGMRLAPYKERNKLMNDCREPRLIVILSFILSLYGGTQCLARLPHVRNYKFITSSPIPSLHSGLRLARRHSFIYNLIEDWAPLTLGAVVLCSMGLFSSASPL